MVIGRAPTAEEVRAELIPALRAIRLKKAQELAAAAQQAAKEAGLTATVLTLVGRELSIEGLCERIERETAELRAAEQRRLAPGQRRQLAGWHCKQAGEHAEAERELTR
jgi:hypothetical protein